MSLETHRVTTQKTVKNKIYMRYFQKVRKVDAKQMIKIKKNTTNLDPETINLISFEGNLYLSNVVVYWDMIQCTEVGGYHIY